MLHMAAMQNTVNGNLVLILPTNLRPAKPKPSGCTHRMFWVCAIGVQTVPCLVGRAHPEKTQLREMRWKVPETQDKSVCTEKSSLEPQNVLNEGHSTCVFFSPANPIT